MVIEAKGAGWWQRQRRRPVVVVMSGVVVEWGRARPLLGTCGESTVKGDTRRGGKGHTQANECVRIFNRAASLYSHAPNFKTMLDREWHI